jgi:Co/Zn/Cd efflux system component
MIVLAAVFIIYSAILKWIRGLEIQNLGFGTLVVLAAALVNAALGWYLVRTGKRNHSLILEANGKHVLTDSWTSFGVVGGLSLVLWTGWKPLDPLCAIAVALNILWSGGHLVWRSAQGLMDYADPATGRGLREKLDALCAELRSITACAIAPPATSSRSPSALSPMTCPSAKRRATLLEEASRAAHAPAEVITHLERRGPLRRHHDAQYPPARHVEKLKGWNVERFRAKARHEC